jgi:hypothetical protein
MGQKLITFVVKKDQTNLTEKNVGFLPWEIIKNVGFFRLG